MDGFAFVHYPPETKSALHVFLDPGRSVPKPFPFGRGVGIDLKLSVINKRQSGGSVEGFAH
jgi:hypothetical protein